MELRRWTYFEIVHTKITERCENSIRFIQLGVHILIVGQWVKNIIFLWNYIYLLFLCPFCYLLISCPCKRCIIDIEPNRLDGDSFMKLSKKFEIFSLEKIQLALQLSYLLWKFSKRFDHKLDTIMRKVWILLGVNLVWRENKNGHNSSILQ